MNHLGNRKSILQEFIDLLTLTPLIMLAIACGDQDGGRVKASKQHDLSRLDEMKNETNDRRQLVHFFDASWKAVAWKVLAEQQLERHLQNQRVEWMTSPAQIMQAFEDAEDEARLVFAQRYGLWPPEEYFPPLESEVSEAFGFGATVQSGLWPQLLREAGLVHAADIPQYLERQKEKREAAEDRQRRAESLALAREIPPYDALRAVEIAELLEGLKKPGPVAMRTLRHLHRLDLLMQKGIVEASLNGVEVYWHLSSQGKKLLEHSGPLDVALEVALGPGHSCYDVTGPLLLGRYFGLGRVVEAGFRQPWRSLFRASAERERWISVRVEAGVVFWQEPRYPGDIIPAVADVSETRIVGEPKAGDQVGFREESFCHPGENPEAFWEKIME